MTYIIKVIGPPGTGKTTRLISYVESELAGGVLPQEIVYTSFTKAAAGEARDRALVKFTDYSKDDFPWFSTIHSICFRLLQLDKAHVFAGRQLKEFCKYYGYELSGNANVPDENTEIDVPEMVLRTDADYFEHFLGWKRNLMLDLGEAYDLFTLQPGIPDGFTIDRLKAYINRRNEYKVDKGLFDFTDFIETCITQDLHPAGIKVIIADEYQDSSPLLDRLLELWSLNAERFYMGGDGYQAVFGFMGADPSIFINHKADENVMLKQSYRCPLAVHDLSRQIVSRFSLRYKDDDFIPSGEHGFVFRNVPEGLDWDEIHGKTFYLHRTHWLLSQAYNDLLRDGIPFMTLRGRQSPLQSSTAKMISTLYKLVSWKSVPIEEMGRLMDYLPTRTTKYMFLRVGAKTECRQLIKEKSNRMITVHDLPALGFTSDFMLYFNPTSILSPFKIPDDEKSYFHKVIAKYGVNALDSEPNTVLSTIHGVKGKEVDNVILNLNLTRRTYQAFTDNPDAEHRLFYVGVTRAKSTVTLLEPDDYVSYQL